MNERPLAEKTIRQHEETFRRLLKRKIWIKDSRTKGTFDVRRAAALYGFEVALTKTEPGSERYKRISIALERTRQLRWLEVKQEGPNQPKRSKQRFSSFPIDWERKLFDAASEALKPIVAILYCSGIRPAEIELGVLVTAIPETKSLLISVRGAKVSSARPPSQIDAEISEEFETGHLWRELEIEASEDPIARWLFEETTRVGNTLLVEKPAKQVTGNIYRLSRSLWPRRKAENRPSAYSLRHAFAARLKATSKALSETAEERGQFKVAIARAMGHRSTLTQQKYGRDNSRVGAGPQVLAADASDDVREATVVREVVEEVVADVSFEESDIFDQSDSSFDHDMH